MLRTIIRLLSDPVIYIGAIVFAILLFGFIIILIFSTRPTQQYTTIPTVQLNIIQAPTYTPSQVPNIENSNSQQIETPIPTDSAFEIVIGGFVQVTGTEGDGLRLRSEPGLENEVEYLASEGQVFQVVDGPRQATGYTWWYLIAPMDQTVKGWAVDKFIIIIENP